MKHFVCVGATVLLLGALLAPTWADSFRCGSKVVSVGDSKFDVLRNCGEPTLREYVGEKTNWKGEKVGERYRQGSARTMPVAHAVANEPLGH